MPPLPSPPIEIENSVPVGVRTAIAELLQGKPGQESASRDQLDDKRIRSPAGPLEGLVVSRAMEKRERRLLRKAGSDLPADAQIEMARLIEQVGIPEELARIAAINSPVNDFERAVIQQVTEFDALVKRVGSPERALFHVGVPTDAIDGLRKVQEFEGSLGQAEAGSGSEADQQWAKDRTLQLMQKSIEDSMGLGSADLIAMQEQVRRLLG